MVTSHFQSCSSDATRTFSTEMSSPDAAAESSAPPQRVVFPNVLERPELHTPYAWFRRHILLFGLYSVWVCGLGFMTGMWLFSFVCIGRTALSLGATPMPWVVQLYLFAMALYYSTHHILFYAKPQGEWKELRAIGRHSLVKYPYFRHAVCIFEDREEECIKEPCKPMVPPNDKLLTAYHPHGVLSAGFAFNGVHSMRFQESNARWLVAENLFWFPLLRDILHWLNFDDVSKDTFVGHMKQDRNVSLIPGGFEEATVYERGKHRAFIKNRFGFIKLALQFGYKVRAAYTFGEEETFHAMPYFLKQRMMLNYWKVPGVVFYGRLLCFFLPLENLELTTVISKPIQMPRIENPTREDVAKYHQIYIDTLVALFERNKHKYAKDPTATLEIF